MLASIERTPLRVLLVDDHADTVDSTLVLLRLYGHDVATASNGPDAIACAAKFQPAVALLDLAMPGMDGFETAREIRRLALPKRPVLIAVTGHGDVASRHRSAEAGFDLHLLKPVPPSVFEHLPVVAHDESLDARAARLPVETMSTLVASHIQMASSLLAVAVTTERDATRERCISRVRRICHRLDTWVRRYPHLRDLHPNVEALISSLRR